MYHDNGTAGLGFQLAMYRFLDGVDEARRIRDEGNRVGIAHAQLDWMIAKHNDLVDRFNRLLNVSEETAQTADRLQNQARQKDREIADLREQLAAAKAEIQDVREVWARTGAELRKRVYAAEDALKELRSQQE